LELFERDAVSSSTCGPDKSGLFHLPVLLLELLPLPLLPPLLLLLLDDPVCFLVLGLLLLDRARREAPCCLASRLLERVRDCRSNAKSSTEPLRGSSTSMTSPPPPPPPSLVCCLLGRNFGLVLLDRDRLLLLVLLLERDRRSSSSATGMMDGNG